MQRNMYNHIAYVLDSSGSMAHLWSQVTQMAEDQIRKLDEITEQENRVSVYKFSSRVEQVCFESQPHSIRLASTRLIGSQTALYEAILRAIDDLLLVDTSIGDHTFLIYVLTDGQENASSFNAKRNLPDKIQGLGDRWTVAAFVPDQRSSDAVRRIGIEPGNIMVWDQTVQGVEEVSRVVHASTQSYSMLRSAGQTQSGNLLQVGDNINKQAVKQNLTVVQPSKYAALYTGDVPPKTQIRDFVESKLGNTYVPGSAFYQLVKPETVQFHKEVMVRDRTNGLVYGGKDARSIIGLPGHDVKVAPSAHADYDIFVGSTSYNRHVSPRSNLIVML